MPAWTACSPGAFPEYFARFSCFPEGKVKGMLLELTFTFDPTRSTRFQVRQGFIGQASIVFSLFHPEIDITSCLVGIPFIDQDLHKINDFIHVVDDARMLSSWFDTQFGHVLLEGCDKHIGQFLGGHASFICCLDNLVIYIRKVGNIGHIKASVFKITADGIKGHHTAGISDMDIVVNRRSTDIHPHLALFQRHKVTQTAGHGIVNFNHCFLSFSFFRLKTNSAKEPNCLTSSS